MLKGFEVRIYKGEDFQNYGTYIVEVSNISDPDTILRIINFLERLCE